MSYGKTRSKMREMQADTENFVRYFRGNDEKTVKDSINIMIEDMDKLADGKEPEVDEKRVDDVREGLSCITSQLLNKKISDWFIEFLETYVLLMSNWNSNTIKDETLKQKIQLVSNQLEFQGNAKDMIKMMDSIRKDFKRTMEREKPALSLAKHYLKLLKEENDE